MLDVNTDFDSAANEDGQDVVLPYFGPQIIYFGPEIKVFGPTIEEWLGLNLSGKQQQDLVLKREQEKRLFQMWKNDGNERALHRIVNAYHRFAISKASKSLPPSYRGDKEKVNEKIQIALVGILKAAKKFAPEKGVMFSTYAQWWIKSELQDDRLRNASVVGMGRGQDAKQAFLNYGWVYSRMERENPHYCHDEIEKEMADFLGIPLNTVQRVGARRGGELSLNVKQGGEDEEGREWIDAIESEYLTAAEEYEEEEVSGIKREFLSIAMRELNDREKDIVSKRRLVEKEDVATLEKLGDQYKLSKERIRQIEVIAFEKLQKRVKTLAREKGMTP